MRIACVYLPSFALQVHVRQAPHRAGTAFAIIHGPRDDKGELVGPKRKILVCSKAAWEMGLRPGMTANQARALAPEATLLPSDPTSYQRRLEALAESFLALSVTVDIGKEEPGKKEPGKKEFGPQVLVPHVAVYLRVPKKSRGDDFGHKLLSALERQGYRGRIGTADNRFTAWVAAQGARAPKTGDLFAKECCTVPQGGSAAFLAPLPLQLLPLSTDIQQILETLGVTTIGDFADLPPPSVGRRWNEDGIDFQSLAQGEGPTLLQGFSPKDQIIESIELDDEVTTIEPLAFSLRPLADRACDRLRGRSMAVGRALLRLRGRSDDCSEFPIEPARPTLDGRSLFDLLRAVLQDRALEHPVLEIELTVTQESDPEIEELDLFDHRDNRPSPEAVDIAIARLESMFGKDSVSSAELVTSHRPERAFRLTPFSPPKKPQRTRKKRNARKSARWQQAQQATLPLVMNGTSGALRLLDPPRLQQSTSTQIQSITIEGVQSPVVATHGPTKVDSEWWSASPVTRDYYEVETQDGGRYWVFKKKTDGRYYLHGIFD
jgi:protein ImuB